MDQLPIPNGGGCNEEWKLVLRFYSIRNLQASFDRLEHAAVSRVPVDSAQEVHFYNVLRNGVLETVKHLALIALRQFFQLSTCSMSFGHIHLPRGMAASGGSRQFMWNRRKQSLDERGHAATSVTGEADFGRGVSPL